jgi:hypothetical protein
MDRFLQSRGDVFLAPVGLEGDSASADAGLVHDRGDDEM